MELEVRVVRGMEGCFVSLPLHVIQILDSTSGGHLPPIVALELRSFNHTTPQLWHVAWSGSSSSSSAIEIAQQFAECISLPDRMAVQVRAIPNPAKATLVTIEPHTEDDWEVLELNAEHAEGAILKQVGIVHEAMRFPLWLHGQTIITFIVVSTFPKKSMVQLVPGTEVAVAPKRRKRPDSHEDSSMTSSGKEDFTIKALLRIQEADSRFFHKCEVNGVEMDVVLTAAVFIHPDTAKVSSLDSLQPVILEPRLAWKEIEKDHATANPRRSSNLASKEANNGILNEKKEVRQAVVRILVSDSVAKGHVMLSQSLRRYLRSSLHSWIYVRKCHVTQKKDAPSFSISPCDFKFGKKEASEHTGAGNLDNNNSPNTKSIHFQTNSDMGMDMIDWSPHDRFIAALSKDSPDNQGEEVSKSSRKGISSLVRSWFFAQLDAIASNTGVGVNSLVLGNRILLHFRSKGNNYAKRENEQTAYNGSVGIRTRAGESWSDIVYVLSNSERSLRSGTVNAYEFTFDEGKSEDTKSINLNLLLEELQLGEGVSFYSVKERLTNKCFNTTISSLSWMGTTASDVTNRLMVLLSPSSGMFFGAYHLPFPGHILIYGPPGSGKTLLATTVAKSVEEHKDVLAHVVLVSCSRLALEKSQNIRQALSGYISEALDHAPSVIVLDDLDSIIASSSDTEGHQSSPSSASLAQYFTDIIDEYEEKRRSTCGIGPVAFIACAQTLTNIPQTLSSSGRFDFHVQLPAPTAAERGALLKHELQKRSLHCSDEILFDVASSCDGYDAYDLEILVDRSVHAAIGRFVSSEERKKPTLDRDDFTKAMKGFLPVAMRDVTKSASEGGRGGWEDVGGLSDIQNSIKEMIELPSKFPNIFSQAPLRMRSNVLLYGPPGCGKTHIVGAAASACSLRFISVKGPELLNKYIGASEQAVRDIFTKAAAAAPCLLFFDEFDSIAPKRGHDNTGVTDRVVNQFLTELDGVEVLTGVFVFAATSRPDLLDAALLRPGRLDRLLFCDFPSQHERLDILTVLSRKLPMAKDVDLDVVSRMTEGFSGADLQALLSDAQLAAVHDFLDNEDGTKTGKMPVITDTLLKSVASNARPSVSEAEKGRLYSIYSQFLEAKRSSGAQSRDTKGKRATLA